MSILGMESWDIYASADVTDYWQTLGANGTVVAGEGRCGSAAYHFNSLAGSGPSVAFDTATDGFYVGFAINETPGNWSFTISGAGGNAQLIFVSNANGSITVYSGPTAGTLDSRTIISTGAGLMTAGHWYHIGVEGICATTGGYVKVWINGVLQANTLTANPLPTGINTRSGTLFAASSPPRLLSWSGVTGYLDDCYWGDLEGSAPWNAFLGDKRIEGQLALTDADGGGGSHQDWSPSTGTDHGALVDDPTPDDDATYVGSSTLNAVETFKFPAITLSSGTVTAIQLMPNIKKVDAGTREIACVVDQGGTLTVGTAQGPSLDSYTYLDQIFQVNPTTGTAWTATTANDMEGGVKVTT